MSTYVRYKEIMYPLTLEDVKKVGYNNLDDYWDTFDLDYKENDNFEVQYPIAEVNGEYVGNYYLCYVLKYVYDAYDGEFGRSRPLNEIEQEKYKEIFSKKLKDVDPSKFRLVDFCYYNGCDAPDYYLAEDEFNKNI